MRILIFSILFGLFAASVSANVLPQPVSQEKRSIHRIVEPKTTAHPVIDRTRASIVTVDTADKRLSSAVESTTLQTVLRFFDRHALLLGGAFLVIFGFLWALRHRISSISIFGISISFSENRPEKSAE